MRARAGIVLSGRFDTERHSCLHVCPCACVPVCLCARVHVCLLVLVDLVSVCYPACLPCSLPPPPPPHLFFLLVSLPVTVSRHSFTPSTTQGGETFSCTTSTNNNNNNIIIIIMCCCCLGGLDFNVLRRAGKNTNKRKTKEKRMKTTAMNASKSPQSLVRVCARVCACVCFCVRVRLLCLCRHCVVGCLPFLCLVLVVQWTHILHVQDPLPARLLHVVHCKHQQATTTIGESQKKS